MSLSPEKIKRLIVDHLRPAFHHQIAKARARDLDMPSDAKAFDAWRRFHVGEATGKAGLRCCNNDDFHAVVARCWDLRDRPDLAFNILAQSPEAAERRKIEWLIGRELERGGLNIAYVIAICRHQYKCSLNDASNGQLWRLFYTVRNRVHAKLKSSPP
jgi:hypothetical protein